MKHDADRIRAWQGAADFAAELRRAGLGVAMVGVVPLVLALLARQEVARWIWLLIGYGAVLAVGSEAIVAFATNRVRMLERRAAGLEILRDGRGL